MTPEGKVFTNQVQTKWMCYNCFVLWCVSGSKAPLLVSGTKENGFILLSVLLALSQNVVSSVADGKSWISMPLSQNGFTMLVHITFLVFGLSLNVHLTFAIISTNWLLALYTKYTLCMANHTCTSSQHSSARQSWCIV